MTASLLDAILQTPEQLAERERILAARYFLVRQGSLGEVFRCGRCRAKHPYLTLMCVEQPFSGIDGGLVAYYKVLGQPGALARMTPDERARLRRVERIVKPMTALPDLGRSHPGLAVKLAASEQLGRHDASIASIALGILEPISREQAQRLLSRINGRNGKLTVPGLNSEV